MSLKRRIQLTLLTLCVVGGLGGAWWLDQVIHSGLEREGEARIQIPRGCTAPQVITLLNAAELAPHPRIAYWVLRYHNTFRALQAGIYVIPKAASLKEVAETLSSAPTHSHLSLTLIPGETVWHAGKAIEAAGLGTRAELNALAAKRAWVLNAGLPVGPERARREDGVAATYLEGFLTPETHFFAPETPLEEVVTTLTSTFSAMWKDLSQRRKSDIALLKEKFGFKAADILTLASLVERETQVASEGPIIAGVFFNRLRVGMRLQTDPTLIYHPDRIALVPTPRHRKDASNPYNTYAHKGLPPGPISSPTRSAIVAVLAPRRHDFLYFCARHDGTGRHVFARTLDEHEANVTRFLKRP